MEILQGAALLAPIPLEHLESGKDICVKEGKVAFGSNAFEVFRELDKIRDGLKVNAFLYASHDPGSQLQVTWHALYVNHVESQQGTHPDGMKYRPSSTLKYKNDNVGHWGIFWEVEKLHNLSSGERLWISELQSLNTEKYFAKHFVPEGPLLIQYP